MMLFSQRKGIKPVKSTIQVDSMDNELHNSLWNVLNSFYWTQLERIGSSDYRKMDALFKKLWHIYFKEPIDISYTPLNYYKKIEKYFFSCEWNEVYDLIEVVANEYPDDSVNQGFMNACNVVLKQEVSAYRFFEGKLRQVTSEEAIAEIEKALEASKFLKPVTIHLKSALDLLTDRKSPDYRNSIKESISSVEAICKLVAGNTKATLGQALKEIENKTKVKLHSSLKEAFGKLYRYTSDAEGIRHALLEESNLDFEDAKFMLVSCSAFINYLKVKSSKAGIKL